MKKIKLTKGVQILLITICLVVVGGIIVGLVSNDKSMAATYNDPCTMTSGCNGKLTVISQYDDTRHQVACGVCGKVGAIINCSWSTSNPVPKPAGNNMHYWYSTCSMCGRVNSNHYSSGACSDGNGDEKCDYCDGETTNTGGGSGGGNGGSGGGSGEDCTCNGSTSYYEDYRTLNDDVHTLYYVCNICGGEWRDAEYIHKFSQYTDNGNGTHSASCKKDCGYSFTENHTFENGVCTAEGCGASEECEHDWEISDYSWPYDGNEKTKHANWYVCSICGENGDWVNDTIENHSWRTPVINNDGTHTLTCEECGWWYEDRGYDYYELTEKHTEETIPAEDATCTTAGSTAGKKCSVCNAITQEPTTIAAKGHTEIEIPGVAATCTTAGSTAGKKCSVCNVVTQEQTTIAAKGHTEIEIPEVVATCTTAGSTAGKKCSVCNVVTQEPITVAAKGHDYENGTCTGCGEEEPITKIEITSTKYKIEGTYIYVQPSTKISDFKSNITTNATEIKVYGNDEEISDNATIATGITIELKNGELSKTFTIIVKGDVNSDGVADFKDLVKVNKARLNKITLEEIYFLAADVNEDGSIDLKDLSKINRFRLNKITEL